MILVFIEIKFSHSKFYTLESKARNETIKNHFLQVRPVFWSPSAVAPFGHFLTHAPLDKYCDLVQTMQTTLVLLLINSQSQDPQLPRDLGHLHILPSESFLFSQVNGERHSPAYDPTRYESNPVSSQLSWQAPW